MCVRNGLPFILGSIFLDPAGMGVTLVTLEVTDLFGVLGDPPGTLGEVSCAEFENNKALKLNTIPLKQKI